MKRLIPAAIILVVVISLCVYSNVMVKRTCNSMLEDINRFYYNKISTETLQQNWQKSKDKLSIFVNHRFLDELSLYVGQLTIIDSDIKSPEFETTQQNIKTLISIIISEQQFALHSFY